MKLRDQRLEILRLKLPIDGTTVLPVVVMCTSRDEHMTNIIVGDADGVIVREPIFGDVLKKPEIYGGERLGTALELLERHADRFDALVAAGAANFGPLTTVRALLEMVEDESLDPQQALSDAYAVSIAVVQGMVRHSDHARQIVKVG